MRILITGGAGLVGSHIADRLLNEGHEVLVFDDFRTGRKDSVNDNARLTLVEASIEDTKKVDEVFEEFNPELVVHAAASYKDPSDWEADIGTNIVGTKNIVRSSMNQKVSRLIYFQTALCYGVNPTEQPITLDHHIDPANSSYAITKTAGEQFIQYSGLDYVSFRLANGYGPRAQSGPVPIFYQRLKAGKKCFVVKTRRDWIFVEDLVDCVMGAISGKGQGVYHISSGSDYAIKDIYDSISSAMGITEPVEERERGEDDAFTILLDPSRTGQDFGWAPKTSLQEGIKRTVEYYEKFGVMEAYTHLKHKEE